MVTENKQMQVRRGTSSAWSSANPVNLDGELGYDKTLNKLKVGDGATAWNTLPFLGGGIIVGRGTFASRPASGTNVGDIYYCTDIGNEYRWNGTSWDVARGGPLTAFTPPPSSGWTTLTTAPTAALDSHVLSVSTASGDNWKGEYRALTPANTYTATFYFDWSFPPVSFIRAGAFLRNSTSGALITFGAAHDSSSGGFNLWSVKWTNATTFSAQYTLSAGANLIGAAIPNWLRIRDDNTNRFYEYSFNGVDWIQHGASTTRTDFLTADQIGWGVNANSATAATAIVRLRSFAGVS